MKKLLIAGAIILALGVPLASAEDAEFPGIPAKAKGVERYRSHLLASYTPLYNMLSNGQDSWEGISRETARNNIISSINQYPDEVNDYGFDDGFVVTPLSLAIELNDVELVRLLLDKGAFPFLPNSEEIEGLFGRGPLVGTSYDMRIIRMISSAQNKYPVYEELRNSQK